MATVEEILADLGVTVDPAKAANVAKWNGTLSASQAEAQKKLEDAQALQRVIDENIRTAGLTETNIAQLQASNAAYAAALDAVKKAGFTGITIPDLSVTKPNTADPMETLKSTIVNGFTNIGQTLNEMNRYQRVFGAPIPEDPQTIADKAAASRLSVRDYVEQTYKVSAKEAQIAQEATAKREAEIAAKAVAEYKEKNPSTAGNPNLNGGLPSNYPSMPKPRDTKSVREFATLSAREKISNAMQRATQEVSSRSAA